ncbi:hypothetical protein [Sphingobium sp.]|uniref:hypothetical protein n=1 Tax=Sphingobium sp. TaxID=1912891 RepID=UPI002601D99E|nr:hypothetical protein [Sphingobium sp.]
MQNDKLVEALERCKATIENHFIAGNLVGLPGIYAIKAVLGDVQATLSRSDDGAGEEKNPFVWMLRHKITGEPYWSEENCVWDNRHDAEDRADYEQEYEAIPLYAHPPAAVAGEGIAPDVVAQMVKDAVSATEQRMRLSQPAADAVGTGDRVSAYSIASKIAVSEYPGKSFDERLASSRTVLAALTTPPRQPDDAVREYRELIAYNIIQGSAGIRAAEHAKDFKTGNWTDALHSADAVISTLVAIGAAQDELRKAVHGIADDYMTSEAHHPGYVLIPTAKFEQIVAALASTKSPDAQAQSVEAERGEI